MSTLSERMLNADTDDLIQLGIWVAGWADEVEALEADNKEGDRLLLAAAMKYKGLEARLQAISPSELSPKDKLMQGYEAIGMTEGWISRKRYRKAR